MTAAASLDRFFLWRPPKGKSPCLYLTAEVWAALTGEDVLERLEGVLNGVRRAHLRGFTELPAPVSPCLALMRSRLEAALHVGVYRDRRIFHIASGRIEFQPIEVVRVWCSEEIRWFR